MGTRHLFDVRGAWAAAKTFASRLQDPAWDGRGAGTAFVVLAVAFYLDKFLLGPWAPVRLHDVFDADFVRYGVTGDLLFRHGAFSWYPNLAGGIPAYAWMYSPFYISCVLAAALPLWLIYGSMVVVLMVAAGWGMFRFLSERVGLPPRSAFLGGTFFALASQIQPNCAPQMVFNYAFPLFYVWSLDAWANRGRWRLAARPLAGMAAILIPSFPILTLPFYPFLHLAVLLFFDEKAKGERLAAARWVCLIWAGYALAFLPMLYSLFSYAPQAARHFSAWKHPGWGSLAGLAMKLGEFGLDFTARSLTFAPLLALLPLARDCVRLRRALALWGILLFIAALNASDVARLWAGTLFAKMDMLHFMWTLPFAAVLSLTLGADELSLRPERRPAFWRALWLALAVLAVLTGARALTVRTLALNVAVGAALGLASRAMPARSPRQLRAWVAAVLLTVVSVRLYRFMGNEPECWPYRSILDSYSFLGKLRRQSAGPWRAGAASNMLPSIVAGYGWEMVDGRSPLMNRRYKDLFKLMIAPQLSDPKAAAYFESYWYNLYLYTSALPPEFNLPLLALANVKYLVAQDAVPQLDAAADVRVEATDTGAVGLGLQRCLDRLSPKLGRAFGHRFPRTFRIYSLRDTFPRGFLARRAEVLARDADVLDALARASTQTLRTTAFFSSSDADARTLSPWTTGPGKPAEEEARLVEYHPDRLEYDVGLSASAILVISNNFHRYWSASIDGAPARVLRADHAFQAVALPQAGKHRVVVEFHDPYLAVTHLGIVLGWLLILLPVLL